MRAALAFLRPRRLPRGRPGPASGETSAILRLGVSPRARELFRGYRDTAAAGADRMFMVLSVAQWAYALAIAFQLTPHSWEGTKSTINAHVFAAIFLGFALCSLPMFLAWKHPGAPSTRMVIAVAQMLWSTLLIHLTGGRIETHFHIFGSLAVLAFYRDTRVLALATGVVLVDHLLRGVFWPQSVYGVTSATAMRFVEHAGWVAFEVVVLYISMRRGVQEWRKLAFKQDSFERANAELREQIVARDAMEVELRHEQKLASMGRLAAGVAHELNTPTQYVVGSATFLQDETGTIVGALRAAGNDQLAADVTAAIDDTVEGVGRIAAIVRSMKDFSHPSKGKKTPVALRAAIETTVAVSRNEWKNIADVVIAVDEELPPVPALRDELNQVVLNMLVNAAHAIEEKSRGLRRGRVEIAARVDGDEMEIRIRDDGAGIPKHIRDEIFEPFFTTKPVGKGTGQGLAIAWAVIVDKHAGTIHVESEEGVGTTFVIRLPLVDQALVEQAIKEARIAALASAHVPAAVAAVARGAEPSLDDLDPAGDQPGAGSAVSVPAR